MANSSSPMTKLTIEGSFDEIRDFLLRNTGATSIGGRTLSADISLPFHTTISNPDWLAAIPNPYNWRDVARFAPSAATYFMDGYSDAKIRIRKSLEEIELQFWDKNTSITASAPALFSNSSTEQENFTPAPLPLTSTAKFPENTPDRYLRHTTYHLMQVVSLNMKGRNTNSRLLIGLPYAEKYPELFFRRDLFGESHKAATAASYGVVQSLTEFKQPNGDLDVDSNGYPARSFFAIYHLI